MFAGSLLSLQTHRYVCCFSMLWCHLVTVSPCRQKVWSGILCKTLNLTDFSFTSEEKVGQSRKNTGILHLRANRASKGCGLWERPGGESQGLSLGIVTVKLVKRFHLDQRINAWRFLLVKPERLKLLLGGRGNNWLEEVLHKKGLICEVSPHQCN